PFEFATAGRIVFGEGTLRDAAPAAAQLGRRALVVTGSSGHHAALLLGALEAAGVSGTTFSIGGEPTIEVVRKGREIAREGTSDVVLAIGGGSAIDGGKAIAALITNLGNPLDYLEVIGRGEPLGHPAAPCIAIPTTAGTGSEVTRNAVLGSPEHGVKA